MRGYQLRSGQAAGTLRECGLDFADAGLVFAREVATDQDTRRDYGEDRYITAGHLGDRMVVVVWTPRPGARHTISMRYCHDREESLWRSRMDRSGRRAGTDLGVFRSGGGVPRGHFH